MTLNDLATNTLKDLVEKCDITTVKPVSDDKGNLLKIIVEYRPQIENNKKTSFEKEI